MSNPGNGVPVARRSHPVPRSNARGNGAAPEYAEVGGRLRAVRLAHGLSLRVLAERLGVSPSLISQVETGRAKPSVSTLYAMSAELGVSLDDLLFPDPSAPGRAAGLASAPRRRRMPPAACWSGCPWVPASPRRRRSPFSATPGQPAGPGQGPAAESRPRPAAVTRAASSEAMPSEAMPQVPFQPAASRKTIRLASGVVWERLTTSSIPGRGVPVCDL